MTNRPNINYSEDSNSFNNMCRHETQKELCEISRAELIKTGNVREERWPKKIAISYTQINDFFV